jgi:hypothetical protein
MRIPHKCLWWDDKNRRREEATFSLDVASSNVSPSSDAQNEQTQLSHPAFILRDRLTVGRNSLEVVIGVRIPVPQHFWVSGKAREFQRAVNPSPMAE